MLDCPKCFSQYNCDCDIPLDEPLNPAAECESQAHHFTDALRTQLKEAVEGLKKYGKHKYDCEWVIYSDPTHQWSCTCGFDALLKRLDG